MVYGILTLGIHKRLTLAQAGVAYVVLCVLLLGCVRLKNRVMRPSRPPLLSTAGAR